MQASCLFPLIPVTIRLLRFSPHIVVHPPPSAHLSSDTSPPSSRPRGLVFYGGQCNPGVRNLELNPPQSPRLNTKKMSEQMAAAEGESRNIRPVTQPLEESGWGGFFFFRLSGLAAGLLLFVRQRVSFLQDERGWSEEKDGWG